MSRRGAESRGADMSQFGSLTPTCATARLRSTATARRRAVNAAPSPHDSRDTPYKEEVASSIPAPPIRRE